MKNYIIGAIHFPTMSIYPDFKGYEEVLENALFDLRAFEIGGANAIIIENNYDVPHTEEVSEETITMMIRLGKVIKNNTTLPVGVSVLWNDFTAAFRIAKEIDGTFIRVPVFVDDVETSYGIMKAKAEFVSLLREKLNAKHVKIYADIHVKHAKIISLYSIEESALAAIKSGADALIITGKWTGDAPNIDDLQKVRKVVEDFPIICGSGVDENNIKRLLEYANGVIVSTSLKDGLTGGHVNLKPYDARINAEKVKLLVSKI